MTEITYNIYGFSIIVIGIILMALAADSTRIAPE